jgi:hypothetical protein
VAGFDDDEDQDIRGKYKRACATLGVTLPKTPPKTPRAEQEQVLTRWKDGVLKKAWQAAAKQWHPDTPTGNADKFKSAKEAYDLLAGLQLRPERPPEPPPEVDLDFADVRPHRAPPAEPGAAWAPRVSRGSDGGMVIDVGFVSFDVSAAQMQALAEARKMAEQMLEARLEQERQALKNRVQREATDKLMDLLGPILLDGVPLADAMARKPKRKKPAKKTGTSRTTVIG